MTEKAIKARLRALPGWCYYPKEKMISAEYRTAGFSAAARLIRRIAAEADRMDHHPDLHLTGYRNLAVVLQTHSAKAVTTKDFKLAARIDAILDPKPKQRRKK